MAYRVINEVGGVLNTGISKSGNAMLLYSILMNQKNKLKFLGKSDENIDIALNAIDEFKKHSVTVESLQSELSNMKNRYLKEKLKDITLIYECYENIIKNRYIDNTDLLTILAEKIEQTNMFKDSIIYIDEFVGFTSQEYNIIEKLLNLAKNVTITVCTDDIIQNNNQGSDIFYSNKVTISKIMDLIDDKKQIETVKLDKKYRFKSPELLHLEENIYANRYQKYEKNIKDIQLFLAKDQYSEVENVAKQIVKNVRDKGFRYKDFAVITKNIDTYSSLIRAIFNEYDIPVFIDEKRELNQNPVIQFVLSLLDIYNKNFSQESVLNYIKTGFLNIEEEEIFKLENYCIKWGIKYNKWKNDFLYGMAEKEMKHEVERLNEIRKEIINPLIELKNKVNNEKSFKNISKCIYEFLEKSGFDLKLKTKIEELETLELVDIANEYKESYKIFISLLDEMCTIFENEKTSFEKYMNILKIGLKNSGLGKIPQVADQVIVGDVDRSRNHKVKTIFIIGLNDGIFPSVNKDEGYLNDSDRELLKSDGIELAKGTTEKLYEDNFNIYKAFSTAENRLFLSYSSTDQEGRSLRPSVIINKIKRILINLEEQSDVISQKQEILTKQTTYEELITNIAALKSGEQIDNIWFDVYKYFKNNKEWNKKLINDIKGLEYSNIPEQINKENVDKLYGNKLTTSISKLERYRSCPFSYYLQYGLKIKEKDELKVQSIDTGTFMHETIDLFFNKIRDDKIKLEDLSDERIKKYVNKSIDELLDLNKNYIFTSSEKYKLLVSRLKRTISKAIKYIIETLTQSSFELLGTEVEFDPKGKYKPIILNLDNGKRVEIIGKIDRIDIGKNEEGKYLRIIDYKSSSKNIDLNEVFAGLQIQLLTYMDAVCKEEDAMAAGVLYFGLLEQMIKADKKMSQEEIEEAIKANFKMKGLILADIKVVKMHDKTLESGASKLVPAYIDKSGNLSKKTNGITQEEFITLQKYIDKTIVEISREILSGKIDLKPYYKKGNTPCKYCAYKAICGFKSGFCRNDYNYIDSKTKEEVLENIKKIK